MTSFDDRDDSLVNGVQMTPDAVDGSLALFSACTRLPPLRDKSQIGIPMNRPFARRFFVPPGMSAALLPGIRAADTVHLRRRTPLEEIRGSRPTAIMS